MDPRKSSLLNLQLIGFLYFCIASLVFVPNFFQVFSSDTQPWYIAILGLSVLIGILSSSLSSRLILYAFLCALILILSRVFMGMEDAITKFYPAIFFIIFCLFLEKKHIDFFLDKAFIVLIFHIALGTILFFSIPSLFEILYSSRPETLSNSKNFDLRSIQYCFPEASYASKVLVLTGVSLILLYGEKKLFQARVLFLLSIFTLSLTGLFLGTLGILYSLKLRYKFFFICMGLLSIYLIYSGLISLPGRLYSIQLLFQKMDISIILNDPSLQTRFSGLKLAYDEFLNFKILGSEITSNSISFLMFTQFGSLGLFFLISLAIVILVRVILFDLFLVLILLSIGYSDTFIFPPTIFVLSLLFRKTFEEIVSFFTNVILLTTFHRKNERI